MATTIKTATRQQKIDFISKNITRGDKKITKKELKDYPDAVLDKVCNKFAESFEEYINTPQVKLQKFFVEATEGGRDATYEIKAPNKQTCIDELKADGIEVTKIVLAKGHHLCKYCNCIAEGSYKDLLCDNCRSIFGHALFSEL